MGEGTPAQPGFTPTSMLANQGESALTPAQSAYADERGIPIGNGVQGPAAPVEYGYVDRERASAIPAMPEGSPSAGDVPQVGGRVWAHIDKVRAAQFASGLDPDAPIEVSQAPVKAWEAAPVVPAPVVVVAPQATEGSDAAWPGEGPHAGVFPAVGGSGRARQRAGVTPGRTSGLGARRINVADVADAVPGRMQTSGQSPQVDERPRPSFTPAVGRSVQLGDERQGAASPESGADDGLVTLHTGQYNPAEARLDEAGILGKAARVDKDTGRLASRRVGGPATADMPTVQHGMPQQHVGPDERTAVLPAESSAAQPSKRGRLGGLIDRLRGPQTEEDFYKRQGDGLWGRDDRRD